MLLLVHWFVGLGLQVVAAALITFCCAQFPFFRGIRVASFRESVLLAVAFGGIQLVLNYFAAPLNWITLGLFGVALSAVALELADFFVSGVDVRGWGWALLLGLLISAATLLIELALHA